MSAQKEAANSGKKVAEACAVDRVDPAGTTEPSDAAQAVLTRLARQAAGMSGADIERLVREARGKARREGRSLTFADVEAALGRNRPKRTDELRRLMAVHEAGHTVVRHVLGVGRPVALSIEDTHGGFADAELDLGVVQSEDWLMRLVAAVLAGRAAELLVFGAASAGSGGSERSDLARATWLALAAETEFGFGTERPLLYRGTDQPALLLTTDTRLAARAHARLEAAERQASEVLQSHRAILDRLTAALLAAGSLEAEDIEAVLAGLGDERPLTAGLDRHTPHARD